MINKWYLFHASILSDMKVHDHFQNMFLKFINIKILELMKIAD